VIRDLKDLQTHWNRIRDFTGSLERTSTTISYGRMGRESMEEEGVRVPVEVVSSMAGSDDVLRSELS